MRRAFAPLGLFLVALALIAVGRQYRSALTSILPSRAAEAGDLTVPPGFRIAVYADDVPNAWQMAAEPPGVVFVGSRSEGKVYAGGEASSHSPGIFREWHRERAEEFGGTPEVRLGTRAIADALV